MVSYGISAQRGVSGTGRRRRRRRNAVRRKHQVHRRAVPVARTVIDRGRGTVPAGSGRPVPRVTVHP